ncbi:MAG: hypothetical protein BGO54_20195 [Sphingobacteriales bacterium 46-32]|nr:MAG: hypothetical protein BGO54_20195 [Sphingobacteriales bacterium 46-32]
MKGTTAIRITAAPVHPRPDSIRLIHVFVALCDNKYQGIVPVPAGIGNGQQPRSNLYWGAGYGVQTYFTRSKDWEVVAKGTYSVAIREDSVVLDRLLLRHRRQGVYLLAEAFDGRNMKETITEFLQAAAGKLPRMVNLQGRDSLYFGGEADLLAFVGHDGLMDFSLQQRFKGDTLKRRETIILACYSKRFFGPHLQSTGAQPLLWTSGLMAPEAYTLHDAINAWVAGKTAPQIQQAAAKAYSTYQRCSMQAATRLLPTGW